MFNLQELASKQDRARFSDPKKVVRRLKIQEGWHVADFGAGSGHYTLALSDLVGEDGVVYAVEIQRALLERIKNEALARGRENIRYLWGDIERPSGTKIKSDCLDAVVIANTLFQLNHRSEVAREIYRILRKGGHLALIDWSDSYGGMGPLPSDIVTREKATELFETVGFTFEEEVTGAGEHHYGLLFKK